MKRVMTGPGRGGDVRRRCSLLRPTQINGAGATFPYPIYSKWFSEYNKLHPNVQINYQSIGSGGGIRQVTNQTVFFGATDGPMTDEQLQAAPGTILHFPTVLGGVVPVYNIPGVTARAEVHRPAARRHLPRQDHEVERPGDREAEPGRQAAGDATSPSSHRSDGSGTTYIWVRLPVEGLAGVQEQGRRRHVGELAGRRRRQGQRGRRRPRQADARLDRLRRADLRAAEQDQLRHGAERGGRVRAGRRSTSVTAAAAGAAANDAGRLPRLDHERAGQRAPIRSRRSPGCCSTRTRRTRRRRRSMVDFMKWALTDGQKFAAELGYAPLPAERRQAGDGGARQDQAV